MILKLGNWQQPCHCAQTCLDLRSSDFGGVDIKVQTFRSCICLASNYCIWGSASFLIPSLMVNLQPFKAGDLKRSCWRCCKYYIGKQVNLPTNIQNSSACLGHISTWKKSRKKSNCSGEVLILIASYLISISLCTAASYHLMQ